MNVTLKNDVRKACELKSLDELKLGEEICEYISDVPLEELIFQVRTKQLHIKRMPKSYYAEIEKAIDAAGFIRHDFSQQAFGVSRLCNCVADQKLRVDSLQDFETNAEYENYEALSDEQIEGFSNVLGALYPKERIAVVMRFGLKGKVYKYDEIENELNVTRSVAHNLVKRAVNQLRERVPRMTHPAHLMMVPEDECCMEVDKMRREILEIRRQVRRLETLNRKLSMFSQSGPSENVREYAELCENQLSRSVLIDEMGLSARARNCLSSELGRNKQINADEVADYIYREIEFWEEPDAWWRRLRNCGVETAREIAEAMNRYGYNISLT